jgi:Tol biopolymer transport system component
MTNDVDRSIITMVRADGSGSTVVHTGLAVAENPVWRPVDGRQLAFRGEDTTATWGVYVMDRTGTTPVHLDLDAGFKDDPYYTENFDYYFQSVAWSPDGTKLMYHTLEPDPTSPAGPGFRIHIADIDHSGAVTAERKLEFDRSADDEFSAAWLPTGDGIVYDHLEGTESHLMSADASGTKPARDLGLVGQEWIGFQISPDGHQVISSVTPIAGSEPSSQVTDLASGSTSPITIPSDFAWQRTAP